MLEKPLEAAVNFWINWSDRNDGGLSEGSLTHQYEDFQDRMRQRHRRFFGSLHKDNVASYSGDPHPLHQLRSQAYAGEGCSITEVAKALCLNQATLQHWEAKWRSQQTVPKSFQTVLMATGYSKYEVQSLNNTYIEWRTANK